MDPIKWTIDQVVDWLNNNELHDYVKNFKGMVMKSKHLEGEDEGVGVGEGESGWKFFMIGIDRAHRVWPGIALELYKVVHRPIGPAFSEVFAMFGCCFLQFFGLESDVLEKQF